MEIFSMWECQTHVTVCKCCHSGCDAFSSTECPTKCQGCMVVMVSHIETTVKLSLILWAEILIKHVHITGSDLFWYLFDTVLFFMKN
jgi:hypothetical protein